MRTKQVTRYYCDHCSKGMFRKHSMASHELSCIQNPLRCCYLCEVQTGTERLAQTISELIIRKDVNSMEYPTDKATHETSSEDAIKWLMKEVDWCPACALAVLRQGKIAAFGVFDYKEELSKFHREKQEELREYIR